MKRLFSQILSRYTENEIFYFHLIVCALSMLNFFLKTSFISFILGYVFMALMLPTFFLYLCKLFNPKYFQKCKIRATALEIKRIFGRISEEDHDFYFDCLDELQAENGALIKDGKIIDEQAFEANGEKFKFKTEFFFAARGVNTDLMINCVQYLDGWSVEHLFRNPEFLEVYL